MYTEIIAEQRFIIISRYSCRENRVAVIEYLIKNPDTYPSMRDTFGVTPLHFACKLVCTVTAGLEDTN